ncbi:RET [Branchiostoma lanceolatum]|uniref:RET protein n=1 Tax=Branchiostoma lanceolatum TaxID=7740 RepID=A0A8K0EFQ5_BRALA|nr:RET [Branchiostoma lanceolatum]
MALRATFCATLLLAVLLDGRQVSENLFVWDENIEIPEDVSVGSTLVWLRDLLAASGVSFIEIDNGTFWSVNITAGDASGRFGGRDEDLAVIVAAPLDYKLHPWYNLTVKLTNTAGNNNDLHVTLVIVVLDVSGYPPFYNKRFVVSGTEIGSDGGFVSQLLKEQQGMGEVNCRDHEWKNKGKITALDISLNDDLPQWVHSDQFQRQETDRYVVAVELNEIWSTSSYWIRCGANVTLVGGIVLFEWTFQYNITGCPEGRYGVYCDKDCVCENGARCHGYNGACECRPGWRGRACDVPWPEVVIVETPSDSVTTYIGTNLTLTCLAPHINVANMTHTDDLELTSVIEPLSAWEVDKEDIRFEHMIGEGEFGHVVRGRLRVPEGYQVLVAAKSIRPDRMTASAVRDFRREMTILTRIHEDKEGHPNVVKLYGVVTKSEPQYILVEYASNEELRRYLWSLREQYKITGNSKLLDRLGFAADVASGLSQLARLKIVHRDIAARNVVISDRKVAKIADFGLSRDVYVSSAYERTNQGGEEELLPLKWMAVESLRDGVYTCESDVWSYGVLLWEIASFGEEPRYAGGPMHPDVCTMLELLKKGVRLQQPEHCPMSVYRIIRSCWIVDPMKRPTPDELFRKKDLMRPQRHAAQLVNHNI